MYKTWINNKSPVIAWIFIITVFMFVNGLSFARAITRGYNTTDKELVPGMVVSLSADSFVDDPRVERATLERINSVIGITTTLDESLLTLTNGNMSVYVKTSGEAEAFVVNLNGNIKKDDLLSLSPLKGIMLKADSVSPIIGIAMEDFNTEEATSYKIKDGSSDKEVLIDKIRVSLDRQANVNTTPAVHASTLTRLGRAVVGKDVAEIRVIAALLLFFIVMIAEGSIIYGAVSSAISSLGRNPLAKGIIRHELVRVIILALAVLALGVMAIYSVLRV